MIYLITIPGQSVCKIGYSKEPVKRLKTLQTANPETLVLDSVIEGGHEQESALHKLFQESRLYGEWFKLTPDIREFFDKGIPLELEPEKTQPVYIHIAIEEGVGILWVAKCRHMGEIRMFDHIIRTCQKKDGVWRNTGLIRKDIGEAFGLGESTILHYVKNFCEYGLLIKQEKGLYKINPEFVSFSRPKY